MLPLLLTALLATSSVAPPDTLPAPRKPAYGRFGFDTSGMDPSVKPGDDFFRYANGNWLNQTPIPANRSRQSIFSLMDDRARKQTRALLDSIAAVPGSRAGDFYASYLDQAAANRQGLTPVQPWLRTITRSRSKQELVVEMARAQRRGVTGLFDLYVQADPSTQSQSIAVLEQNGLGLPGREDYLDPSPNATPAKAAYQRYLVALFQLAGEPQAAPRAQAVVRFETQLARGHWTPQRTRDVTATANRFTSAALQAGDRGFPWNAYLPAIGVSARQSVLAKEPSAFQAETRAWQATPLPVLRDWLWLHTLDEFAPYLERFQGQRTVRSDGAAVRPVARAYPLPQSGSHRSLKNRSDGLQPSDRTVR